MQLKSVLNKFAKSNIEVTKVDRWGTGNFIYLAKYGDRQLEFRENGIGSNHVTHFTLRDPQHDASIDMLTNSFFETIKGAERYLLRNSF